MKLISEEETRPCPQCGANMLRRPTGNALLTHPVQYPTRWRCGCGHSEPGEPIREQTPREKFLEDWQRANPGRVARETG